MDDDQFDRDPRGPWFEARYDGQCADCASALYEGDRIRADGYGGYLCEDCGSDES